MFRRPFALVLTLTVGSFLAIGCAASEDDTEAGEGALTPSNPRNTEEQRSLCDKRVKENGAMRDPDLDVGVVRWKCGDVKGVNSSDGNNDFGQEYCEFHAVQEGTVVDKVAKSKIKPAKVECLFTGVYRDVKGANNREFGEKLNKQLTDGEGNLKDAKGKALPSLGVNPFSIMNGQFNSRGAATALLNDCHRAAMDPSAARRVNAASDEMKCGADGSNCASARDIEACTLIENNGVGWRNSDPVICGRAARGALCGADYSALPDALDGFIMTDWQADLGAAVKLWTGKSNTPPSAPDKCRYATIDGKPYLHLMICDPDDKDITNPKYEGNLQLMCSEVFGPKIAMTAPLGLVTTTAKDEAGFCAKFNKGVKTLQSVAK